ncbi:MAG: bifunctional UDP-N-acetylmuramoyl-tripeptide:D-alanyl-D-alanine ligase/alanine racemase [Bacteroidetes bacterium]|nr:bifunctional UDP-N-acetylmuramoyl-tripeptide:D-alanyl-D-alanine ligase/alanine racemase [Bacteroidota bacterium]
MSDWRGYDVDELAAWCGATHWVGSSANAVPGSRTTERPGSGSGAAAEQPATRGPEPGIYQLATDSRSAGLGSDTLFIALKGKSRDGHRFLLDAYQQGVRCFLAEQSADLPGPAHWLLHPDPLGALQAIAAAHRARFRYPVMGITGSNGKTIIKEWLAHLLAPDFFVVRNPRSFNSQIGVPLSVWAMRPYHEIGVFEAGISLPGEMPRLQRILRPDIGLFTQLGAAHDEGFANRTQKLQEKLALFSEAKVLLYCADQLAVADAIQERYPDRERVTWSAEGRPADLQASCGDRQWVLQWRGREFRLIPPFDDPFSRENLLHALTAALHLGVMPIALPGRVAQLTLPELRLNVQRGVGGLVLVNDAYSADLGSLQLALAYAARQGGNLPRTAVLSDLEESGMDSDLLCRELARSLRDNGYSRLLAVGPAISRADAFTGLEVNAFEDTDALLQALPALELKDQLVLIKGARRFHLERVADALAEKVHGTRLEINLTALAHNFSVYRDRVPAGTKIMVMVKALGYGAGDAEVARVLEFARADYLGVAYADEGVALRQAGITLKILVLNAALESLSTLQRYDLEPEVYDLATLEHIREHYPGMAIHLKLDTGMHRLGLSEQDVHELVLAPQRLRGLRLAAILSHLSAAEDPAHDAFTRDQLARFERYSNQILQAWTQENPNQPAPLRHLLNSAGVLRFPEAAYDMVRLGIGLYGYDPAALFRNRLRPVSRLLAAVAQIRLVPAGESVGYGRAAMLDKPTRVATLTIGYADGLRRSLGKGIGAVAAHGKRMPLIGNVCMDMCMVDATAVPELQEGEAVEVFGGQIRLEEFAAWMQTIPYEVLTSVSSRVKRVYFVE